MAALVVLIAPTWCAPARPGLLIAPELERRWGGDPRLVVVEEPTEELLDLLAVDVVPTWIRLEQRATPRVTEGDDEADSGPDHAECPEQACPAQPRTEGRRAGEEPVQDLLSCLRTDGVTREPSTDRAATSGAAPGDASTCAPKVASADHAVTARDASLRKASRGTPWVETARLEGAQPKHLIHQMLVEQHLG